MSPTVSALLATHRPTWLDDAIVSVLNQTYGDFELLVLDDAGPPECRQIVERHADPRIRYLRSDRSLGAAGTHWRGLDAASGKFVAVINDDDLWEPDLLQKLVAALDQHPEALASFSCLKVIDADGNIDADKTTEMAARLKWSSASGGVRDLRAMLFADQMGLPVSQAMLFRSDAVRFERDHRVGAAWDAYLGWMLASTGRPVVFVPEQLSRYRVHSSSITANRTVKRALTHFWAAHTALRQPGLQDHAGFLRRFRFRAALEVGRVLARRAVLAAKHRSVEEGVR